MAAASKTVPASDTISPKVFWPMVAGLGLTFLGTVLAAITPEALEALGPMAVPVASGATAVATLIVGYLKSDILRTIGVEATAAVLPAEPPQVFHMPDEVLAEEGDNVADEAAARTKRSSARPPEEKGLTPVDPAVYAEGNAVER